MSELDALARKLNITGSVNLRITDYDGRVLDLPFFNGPVHYSLSPSADLLYGYWRRPEQTISSPQHRLFRNFGRK
jgi:hypothetical protein